MKGVYLFFLELEEDCRLRVGGLGEISFEKGTYVYVGSAQNNLEKRLTRHVAKEKKRKWHIDYVTSSKCAKPLIAYAYALPKKYECILAEIVRTISGSKPIKRFGSSDCKCISHFFKIGLSPRELAEKVSEEIRKRPDLILKLD